MENNKILGIKSNQYVFAYTIAFVLSTIVAIIMYLPVLRVDIKESWPYLITSIIFIVFDVILIILFINFKRRPVNLIEIDGKTLVLNRSKKETIIIPFEKLVDSTISFTFFGIFVHNSGAIILKTTDNRKYRIGYLKDYIKISGQINSIKFIEKMGGKLWDLCKD